MLELADEDFIVTVITRLKKIKENLSIVSEKIGNLC